MCIDVEKSQLLAGTARERVSSLLRCCQCLRKGGKKKSVSSCYSSQPSGSAHLASLFGYKPTDKSTESSLTSRVVDVKKEKETKLPPNEKPTRLLLISPSLMCTTHILTRVLWFFAYFSYIPRVCISGKNKIWIPWSSCPVISGTRVPFILEVAIRT